MSLYPQHPSSRSRSMPQAAGRPHFLGGFTHTEHDTSTDMLPRYKYFGAFRVASDQTSSYSYTTTPSITWTVGEAGYKCAFSKCGVNPHLIVWIKSIAAVSGQPIVNRSALCGCSQSLWPVKISKSSKQMLKKYHYTNGITFMFSSHWNDEARKVESVTVSRQTTLSLLLYLSDFTPSGLCSVGVSHAPLLKSRPQ